MTRLLMEHTKWKLQPMGKLFIIIVLAAMPIFKVNAEWVSSNIDRVQILPNGNVNFWFTAKSTGCGTHELPYRVENSKYAVDINGVKSFTSVLTVAISTGQSLGISVRDEQCYVDSIVLHN